MNEANLWYFLYRLVIAVASLKATSQSVWTLKMYILTKEKYVVGRLIVPFFVEVVYQSVFALVTSSSASAVSAE